MQIEAVDLFYWKFWCTVLVAIALLVPLVNLRMRPWVFAGINLGFLRLILGWEPFQLLGVVLTFALFYWAVHRISRRHSFGLTAIVSIAMFAFFLINKRPDSISGAMGLKTVLQAVSYSYVALRAVEVVRAANSGDLSLGPAQMFNYLMPFHMLAAGPIQSLDEFSAQQHTVPESPNANGALAAVSRIANGMFKKYVVAFLIERLLLTNFSALGWYTILEVQFHFIWFYLDFSAYSDIAVGVGQLIGIPAPENFNRPYLSRNLIDFWERWHISLSQWLRRNLFIPLQLRLSRTAPESPILTSSLALFVTFILCGLWHGISWPFVIWATMHAAGVVATNIYRSYLLSRIGRAGVKEYMASRTIRVVATAITFEYVAISTVVLSFV